MIAKRVFASVGACLLALSLISCASNSRTIVKISGTAGDQFTTHYRAGIHSNTVTTQLKTGEPSAVARMYGTNLDCDIQKHHPQSELKAEVIHGNEVVLQVEVPPGQRGTRIWNVDGEWRSENY